MINKAQWRKRLDELLSKNMIDSDQKETLVDMLNSPDQENVTVLEAICSQMIKERLSVGLNNDQGKAFDEIINWFESSDRKEEAIVLKGYAGTGKTFLVKRLIEYISQTNHKGRIAVTAPTNKAVQVLYKNASNLAGGYVFEDVFDGKARVMYSTAHKLLGLREVITESGDLLFTTDKMSSCDLSMFSFLIVDEVSMLDDQLCKDIMSFSDTVKIIFMGDPAQIPPVKRSDSIPFRPGHGYDFLVVELNEIMRQKGDNPIVEASFKLRNNLSVAQPIPKLETKLNDKEHGIIFIDEDKFIADVRPILKTFFTSEEFKQNSDYVKVIAWRNKTIDYVNGIVREMLYGEKPDTYIVGETLIAQKPIFEKSFMKGRDYQKMLATTSEELQVKNVKIEKKNLNVGSFREQFKVYILDVTSYDPIDDMHKRFTIQTVHEDSQEDYNRFLNKVKDLAVKAKSPAFWVLYYDIIKWSANVSYNYALTAHKSQGSTYQNVILLENDLDYNHKIVERNRIKYTAYSRASEKLYILRKNK